MPSSRFRPSSGIHAGGPDQGTNPRGSSLRLPLCLHSPARVMRSLRPLTQAVPGQDQGPRAQRTVERPARYAGRSVAGRETGVPGSAPVASVLVPGMRSLNVAVAVAGAAVVVAVMVAAVALWNRVHGRHRIHGRRRGG